MPEITFYVLATESIQDRYLFACKLIEKAYRNGVFAYVLTDSDEQSRVIDDLLWTFRAGSFIPHQIYDGKLPEYEPTVLIGSHEPPPSWRATVINLSSRCPPEYEQAGRILEILDNSEETKTWGRQRYRQYQQTGIDITTHKL